MKTQTKIDIRDIQNRKGLGTTDMLGVIPVGKKGDTLDLVIDDGWKLTYDWGGHIRDAEIRTAILLMSYTLQSLDPELMKKVNNGEQPLPDFSEDGQPIYTNSIVVNAGDLSAILYDGDRKKRKRVFTQLQHLEKLILTYSKGSVKIPIRWFLRPAYKKGRIAFDVSNHFINTIGEKMQAFRLLPIIQNNGLAMRLALFIETNQSAPAGHTYKDSDGIVRQKYYPKTEYKLDDMTTALNIRDTQQANEREAIKRIKDAFTELKESDPMFPKFTYNRYKRVFESEHKKGVKDRLI